MLLYKKISKVIPVNVQDGSELAGSTKFKFRAADDPRFTDRRMQALLRKLNDLFSEISVSEAVQIRKIHCYLITL